ncbi:hypothetical protein LOZ12_005065 [Ophidiomyces ophidiicola]|uniref:Uncharacterized protein n=1 Tax=Ophidiomyces ophidiicola TaxID=1387563 RepID=A0ACB8UP73_9EURO|nr:uncharacterized protein LOZ57_005617 [Ophidiomyces ophidiicola]KAI1905855.1 hypothetical protein LOZ64_006589 [Ophidiomyces ophidiicola]KAI1941490.1 hypothetical protein LOZ57_005617 [Ophidiomyces ophidiicola]KAI1941623.1 hypothetical protein LOZ62_004687 [Ophidiomyces ophidiicola]KAI1961683.1 hypothetical protein LOZ59_002332 [Ophidiomyces ophidiicola]KAI2002040.1 hypothetical protein LOZ50_005233 [Ophidiomyces ophidiicola]
MAPRTISLIAFRNSPSQRAHFAIFVPSASNAEFGTLIHVIGAPMAGYQLEFKRGYNLATTHQLYTQVSIGGIDSQHISDLPANLSAGIAIKDSIPKCSMEVAATQVLPPRISENFLAPVNDTTNRRCQEWTMDYVRRLVSLGYIDQSAIQIVQSERDPPTHGVGLNPAGAGRGRGRGQ